MAIRATIDKQFYVLMSTMCYVSKVEVIIIHVILGFSVQFHWNWLVRRNNAHQLKFHIICHNRINKFESHLMPNKFMCVQVLMAVHNSSFILIHGITRAIKLSINRTVFAKWVMRQDEIQNAAWTVQCMCNEMILIFLFKINKLCHKFDGKHFGALITHSRVHCLA